MHEQRPKKTLTSVLRGVRVPGAGHGVQGGVTCGGDGSQHLLQNQDLRAQHCEGMHPNQPTHHLVKLYAHASSQELPSTAKEDVTFGNYGFHPFAQPDRDTA